MGFFVHHQLAIQIFNSSLPWLYKNKTVQNSVYQAIFETTVMNERFIVICNFLVVFIFNWVYFGHSVYVALLDT